MFQTPIIDYNRVAALPASIRSFCHNNDGWIVGSGAQYLLSIKDNLPRDWDLLIPFWTWGMACKTIPEGSPTNSQGGIKLLIDGLSIDVWAGDIGWFMAQIPNQPAYAIHPKSMTYLTSGKESKRVKSK